MSGPIKPSEVVAAKAATIPNQVFEVINHLISSKWNGKYAKILQQEIVDGIITMMQVERKIIFDSGWLNFEDIYREEGWKILYDKPGYNENYQAYFEFTK